MQWTCIQSPAQCSWLFDQAVHPDNAETLPLPETDSQMDDARREWYERYDHAKTANNKEPLRTVSLSNVYNSQISQVSIVYNPIIDHDMSSIYLYIYFSLQEPRLEEVHEDDQTARRQAMKDAANQFL